jgi:Glycosyl transferase family 2
VRVSGTRITAVGIVIPARDEQQRIGRCLRALRTATAALPPTVAVAVCVVADRCADATVPVARRAWGRRPGLALVTNAAELTVGQVRDLGVRALLPQLPAAAAQTWLLSTDADTVVPPSWILDHLRYADAGADAVAGAIDLDSPQALPPDALCRYADLVAAGTGRHRHRHAYAANLGVRAAAYARVGGFPAVASGEEHALLALLRRGGHPVVAPTDVRARTSARLHGRARDGLADLLLGLVQDSSSAGAADQRRCAPSAAAATNPAGAR